MTEIESRKKVGFGKDFCPKTKSSSRFPTGTEVRYKGTNITIPTKTIYKKILKSLKVLVFVTNNR